MSLNRKNRDVDFQSQITNFTNQLHELVGFAKRGRPESKKKIRFNVCPKCEMKNIAQEHRSFSQEYLFPCICDEPTSLKDYSQEICDPNIVQRILQELKNQSAVNFDMVCIVDVGNNKWRKKIAWKPLRENTWNRNNQPTCDNIRITAVSKAFVTIANTEFGDIELHVSGPSTINTKPYARLGVGINMLSKQHWKPGFLFMTSDNKKLKQDLRLELRYPLDFEGKINIQWPRRGREAPFDSIFDINIEKRTNKNDVNFKEQHNIGFSVTGGYMQAPTQMGESFPTFITKQCYCDYRSNSNSTFLPFDYRSSYQAVNVPNMEYNLSDCTNLALLSTSTSTDSDVVMQDNSSSIESPLTGYTLSDSFSGIVDENVTWPPKEYNTYNSNYDYTMPANGNHVDPDLVRNYASSAKPSSLSSTTMNCDNLSQEEICSNADINKHRFQGVLNMSRTYDTFDNVINNAYATQYW